MNMKKALTLTAASILLLSGTGLANSQASAHRVHHHARTKRVSRSSKPLADRYNRVLMSKHMNKKDRNYLVNKFRHQSHKKQLHDLAVAKRLPNYRKVGKLGRHIAHATIHRKGFHIGNNRLAKKFHVNDTWW